jgi:hypothetical protein
MSTIDLARAFLDELVRGDLASATARFDATMSAALPADKLAAVWAQIQAQAGAFEQIGDPHEERGPTHTTVLVPCRFARAVLVAKIIFDNDEKLAGLFFVPAPSPTKWEPPAYARPDAFTEREVKVGDSPALPGMLTLPAGTGPFPAAVLVHGSGPNDADETIGGAKVFKDLALGLASRGIAVLRYVKRTRHAPAGVATVKEEVLDAARAAVDLCRATPDLDPARVVVIGHSQGAELAPRIAAEPPGVAAIVMLAPPARPLADSVLDQFAYLCSLAPDNQALAQMAEAARAFKARVEAPDLRPEDEIPFPAGGTLKGEYLLSLRGYRPTEAAAALTLPILVLHADRDYQVNPTDREAFERALAGKPNVTMKRYPSLNHLFIAGEGPSSPAEYERPGHVAEEVIADIAAFVNAPRGS